MSATATARRRPAWSPGARSEDLRAPADVTPSSGAVVAVKAVHTAAWASIEACVAYVLWTGLVGRTDRRVGVAAAVVAGESLVFAGNGFRCP